MNIKTIHITGTREGEAKTHLYNKLRVNDLIFSPIDLMQQFYVGTKPYGQFLKEHNLNRDNISTQTKTDNIETALMQYNKILNLAKSPFDFQPEFANLNITKVIANSDILMEHTYNLSEFSQNDFDEIAKRFKAEFTSSTPLAYLNISEKKINVIESFKTLYMPTKAEIAEKKGAKRLMSAISFRDRENIVSGINKNVLNFDKFNFNMNTELQLLNKIIRETVKLNAEDYQTVYKMNNWDKAFYENDLIGTNENENTIKAKQIIEASNNINKAQHSERQGSLTPNSIKDAVTNRDLLQSELPPKRLYSDETMQKIKNNHQTTSEDKSAQDKNNTTFINIKMGNVKTEKTLDILDDIDKLKALISDENSAKKDALYQNQQEKLTFCFNNSDKLSSEYFDLVDETGDFYRAKELLSQRYLNNKFIDAFITTEITSKIQLGTKTEKLLELTENKVSFLEKQVDEKNSEIKNIEEQLSDSIIQAEVKEKKTQEELIKFSNKVELIIEDQKSTNTENNKLKEYIIELEKLTESQTEDLGFSNNEKDELKTQYTELETYSKNLEETILEMRKNSLQIQEAQNNKIQEILEAKDKQSDELFKSINTIKKLEDMIAKMEKQIENKEVTHVKPVQEITTQPIINKNHEDMINPNYEIVFEKYSTRDNTDDIEDTLNTLFVEMDKDEIVEEQEPEAHKKVHRMR